MGEVHVYAIVHGEHQGAPSHIWETTEAVTRTLVADVIAIGYDADRSLVFGTRRKDGQDATVSVVELVEWFAINCQTDAVTLFDSKAKIAERYGVEEMSIRAAAEWFSPSVHPSSAKQTVP